MKTFASVLCLFAVLGAIPAFGTSIPTSFTGVGCDGSLSSTFICFASSSKTGMETFAVANPGNLIYIPDGYNYLRAGISSLVFNSSLNTLTGTFSGDEFLVGASPEYTNMLFPERFS
jgi:hypothetical protein